MTRLRGRSVAPGWARAGLRAGLLTSVQVPIGIIVIGLVPALWSAYPLLVLPLLLAGPLAAGRLRLRYALSAAALAGVVSGVIAAVSLAVAWQFTGNWFWMMNAAAGAPPMPPIPRIMLLPTDWMSWAQQDILFFQAPLAVLLTFLARALRPAGSKLSSRTSRFLPRSIGGRLRLAFGALILLTLMLGMVGFGMIEEMHVQTHRVQLRADWQLQLGTVRAALDEELTARVAGTAQPDGAMSATRDEQVTTIYQTLASTSQRPGRSARPEDLAAALTVYRAAFEQAVAAHQGFQAAAAAGDPDSVTTARLVEAITAVGNLQRTVEADLVSILVSGDLGHHQRLILVMVLVGLVAGLGLWTSERVLQAVGLPLMTLGVHVRRVARGDFSRRVLARGPEELRQLSQSVNQMTGDLARLYAVERERRTTAEALATREHELSAAKEFWTNTLVHDLKNPLTLIVGWTDLLEHGQDGPLSASQHEGLQQIRRAASVLEDLVADVNDSFRLQADALPMHREAVAPDALIRSAASEYCGPDRPAPDLHIMFGVQAVLADARLVGRVFHNLIGNAYKHGGEGTRVRLVAHASDGAVCFGVDDDGPGIPEGERERVFERFVQGQGGARGSGLGLAFCKLVIEQLGGRIWATTSPLGGTRIAFELPHASAPAAAQPPTALVVPAEHEDSSRQPTRLAPRVA